MANIHVVVDGDTVLNVVSGADASFFVDHPDYKDKQIFDFTGQSSWPSPGWKYDGNEFIAPEPDVEGNPIVLLASPDEEEVVPHPNANNVPGLNPEE